MVLSYRHAFHAGGKSDVLKHVVLLQLLKDAKLRHGFGPGKRLRYVDSHAGAGTYDLQHAHAQQTGEWQTGVQPLVSAVAGASKGQFPQTLVDYANIVLGFDVNRVALENGAPLEAYPGSPLVASMALERSDALCLFELHSSDFPVLKQTVRGMQQDDVSVTNKDGLLGMLQTLTAKNAAAVLTLVDPSYEIKTDYKDVASVVQRIDRFGSVYSPNLTLAVWYPLLRKSRHTKRMLRTLHATDADWVDVSMHFEDPMHGNLGLYGSGMFVHRPPSTLRSNLDVLVPRLAELLSVSPSAFSVTSSSDSST